MLGQRITLHRKKLGLSQTDLAQKLCISPSAIGMYEQGRREPSLQGLMDLAAVFGVTADYMLTGRPANPQDEQIVAQLLTHAARPKSARKGALSREEQVILLAAMSIED